MSLEQIEQIEQMVRAANPVPDVAILGESVPHRGRLDQQEAVTTGTDEMLLLQRPADAPTPGHRSRPGQIPQSLNGEQVGDADERDAHTTPADDRVGERHPGRRWMLVAAATIAVLTLGLLAVIAVQDPDSVRTDNAPPTPAPSTNPATTSPLPGAPLLPPVPFVGVWLSTDTDGSSQAMEIRLTDDRTAEMTLHDAAATVLCSGAAANVSGTGALDSRGDLVVTISALSCEDGSEPRLSAAIVSGYMFTYRRRSDTIIDNAGVVWRREGADEPSAAPPTSGAMWPQSSVDELPEAQELADAGDPAYTWQVDPQLSSEEWWAYLRQPGAEIVERFLREELGWEGFLFNPYADNGADDGVIHDLVYLRCAPGETNPLYPIAPAGHQEAPGAERCAPTIDDLHYETVSLDLAQLDRRGRDGIWVVSRWATAAPFAQRDPWVVEDDATARLEDFLRARIDGEGAEGYVEVGGTFGSLEDVPLLYATTTGAPYERSEIERSSGPHWPYGDMEFIVRLFAEGGETVVEQRISLFSGQLSHDATETTDNGEPFAVPYVFFDGEVTASAPNPWEAGWRFAAALTLGDQGKERVELVADPFPVATGCARGPAASDASALARSIQSDPDLQVTPPVGVSLGGVGGMAMDITVAEGASVCEVLPSTQVLTQNDSHTGPTAPGVNLDQGSRMRLYLIDLPERSATRVLAIAIVAPEARFDDVIEAAAPIIESIEFHPQGR